MKAWMIAASLGATLLAADGPKGSVKMITLHPGKAAAPASGGTGMIAVLENGVYREPTAEDFAAIRAAGTTSASRFRSAPGPTESVVTTKDGQMRGMLVPDEFLSATVAAVGKDGKLRTRCVTGTKSVKAALRQAGVPSEK